MWLLPGKSRWGFSGKYDHSGGTNEKFWNHSGSCTRPRNWTDRVEFRSPTDRPSGVVKLMAAGGGGGGGGGVGGTAALKQASSWGSYQVPFGHTRPGRMQGLLGGRGSKGERGKSMKVGEVAK